MKRLWESSPVRFVREMVTIYFDKRVYRNAAELAYFLVLTFFPILICINAFIGVLHVNVNAILAALEPVVPPSLLNIVSEYLRYITVNESPALLAAGAAMTLFPASAAVRSLMDIMDDIYERRTFYGIRKIVASVAFSLFLLVTIYLSLVVVLTGNWFFHFLERRLPFRLDLGSGGSWLWVRFLLLFGVVLLLILLVYFMSAGRQRENRPPVLGGAVAAAVALVAASMLFSWFIGMSSQYSLVYGSLASVVIMLLWLYLCGNILILGNVLNCVRYRRKRAREAAAKKTQKTR